MAKVLLTGGAGFIGSSFVHLLMRERDHELVNVDALTYAGNPANLKSVEGDARYRFYKADIADPEAMKHVFGKERPDFVVHMAAESHVDRSVKDATDFVRTNVVGTQVLLDQARACCVKSFVHVSTDEVYGSLGETGRFTESSPIQPNSPYSASKAGSDLLARAAWMTHGFETIITRCSNNYGPYQFPEKLIPLMILNCFEGKPLPVYGDGLNIRDWIHVEDHCRAVLLVMEKGKAGEVYNVGGDSERRNIDVVRKILELAGGSEDLIRFVKDRPGHDLRYAIDGSKIQKELGFVPSVTFEEGLEATVAWYRENREWCEDLRSGKYLEYYEAQYGKLD